VSPPYLSYPAHHPLSPFSFQCSPDHRDLPSFPTRRSSDLCELVCTMYIKSFSEISFSNLAHELDDVSNVFNDEFRKEIGNDRNDEDKTNDNNGCGDF